MPTHSPDPTEPAENLTANKCSATAPPSSLVQPMEFLEWFSLFACVVAPLPLVALHFLHLDTKPHYECAPLVALVAVGLLYRRWRDAAPADRQIRGANPLTWSLMISAFLMSTGALLTGSPWLGMITWILSLASVLSRTQVAWKGPWGLLWLTLPLPLGFDDLLIQRLQILSSRWSSHLLDLVGVLHILEGNIVRLSDRDLFVDEACSGVMSLIAVIAAAAILTVLRQRPLLHSWPTVLLSGFWAVVMNVARIVVCAWAWQQWKLDLLSGIPHELLGFATFAGALLLMLSSEQLVLFFLGAIELPVVSSWEQIATANPLVSFWNWLAGAGAKGEGLPVGVEVPRITLSGSYLRAGLALACMVCVLGRLPTLIAAEAMRDVVISPYIWGIDESFLPEKIGPWRRMNFKVDRRPKANVFGEHSKTWTYEYRGVEIQVSIDYPFFGWHELRSCYTGVGWKHTPAEATGSYWASSRMRHPQGTNALLMFSMLDIAGRDLPPQHDGFLLELPHKDLADRLWDRVWKQQPPASSQSQTCQLQLLATWTSRVNRDGTLDHSLPVDPQLVEEALDELHHRMQRLLKSAVVSTSDAVTLAGDLQ